jgi:hypothetical protein
MTKLAPVAAALLWAGAATARTHTVHPGQSIAAALAAAAPGDRILMVAADTTTVTGNRVTGNPYAGVSVTSLCLGLALQGLPCQVDIDPLSDGTRVVGNAVRGNGTVPLGDPLLDALRADLSWDGTGTENCWSENAFGTSAPSPLPACTRR